MLKLMEKLAELKRAKLLALSLLLIAAAIFITTLVLPPTPWVGALKAISEAAMVGALADWFAVVALFRRIPLPFVARHTAIIPRNKDRIADNLGYFVQEKFLDTPSLVALIRRYEPALMLGNWFSQPENARRVGQHLLQVMSGFLELTDDARIQRLLRRAVHKAIDKIDLTQTSAMMLEGLTRDNRHQKLLDSLISQLIALLQRDSSRAFIARGIVHWLETEHPLKARLLPTEWLGEHSAEMVTDAVNTLLDEVSQDRAHQIRQAFDRAALKLIDNLKSEVAGKAKGLGLGSGLLALRRQGWPLVATIHHPISRDRRLELEQATGWERLSKRRWYGFVAMQRRVARRSSHILTVSEGSAQDIVTDFAVPAERIDVVPWGVDLHTFAPDELRRLFPKTAAEFASWGPSWIDSCQRAFADLDVDLQFVNYR